MSVVCGPVPQLDNRQRSVFAGKEHIFIHIHPPPHHVIVNCPNILFPGQKGLFYGSTLTVVLCRGHFNIIAHRPNGKPTRYNDLNFYNYCEWHSSSTCLNFISNVLSCPVQSSVYLSSSSVCIFESTGMVLNNILIYQHSTQTCCSIIVLLLTLSCGSRRAPGKLF